MTPVEDSPYLGWPGRERPTLGNQLSLGLCWFPNNVLWTGLLLIVLPERVLALVGPGAATGVLSLASLLGALVAILVRRFSDASPTTSARAWGAAGR